MIKKEIKGYKWILTLGVCFLFLFFLDIVSANNYTVDIYFTTPSTFYTTNEMISFRGYLYQSNYTSAGTLVSNLSVLSGASVNFTIINGGRTMVLNHTFTTDVNGSFYSNSTYRPSAKTILAPSTAGSYFLRAEYRDPNDKLWFSEMEISILNKSLDIIQISTEKVKYFASQNVKTKIEALKQVGDQFSFVANVSVNGTLRNSTKFILSSFNCTTGNDGKCFIDLTAPTTLGKYYVELNNFSAYGSFFVVPFSTSIYMRDELGKSVKNVYAQGEKATVEVSVSNASSDDVFSFSGYIADSQGNVVKSISSTTLNNNNSFKNVFLFNVDSLTFDYGSYFVSVSVSESGGSSMTLTTSFEVKDWALSLSKASAGSGFEYEYSTYPNKTLRFEAFPKLRSNGTIIADLNSSSFSIELKNELGDVVVSTNTSWNASCSKSGCYDFSLKSPLVLGKYKLIVSLSHLGIVQVQTKTIDVIDSVLSIQTSNSEGVFKELFGTNEFVYLKLKSSNLTSDFNLSDAEIFSVFYMNGSEQSYTKLDSLNAIVAENSVNEWAWNVTSQTIKMDVPKYGGVYDVFVYGNNKSIGAQVRFIVRPYETCTVSKDTAGTVSSGNYYAWQFKKSDTIYFEIKIIQASNPTGKASASNFSAGNSSGGSSYGISSGCSVNTATQQVINNATLSVIEAINSESGNLQNINSSESVCQSSDSSGGYTCTVKPLSNWEGGSNVVKFKIIGPDGTEDVAYGKFEARAFYLYGWSSNWQNNPLSNITLNVRLYEAGSGWWGSSGGLSGTITLKRVEYMGSDGDWIWPPVDSGYNVSNVSSSSVTSGSGTLNVLASANSNGKWKTGNYRAVMQGTTSNGDTDYGYAYFGVKLWDVYGYPIECKAGSCEYKNYFSSRENITLFIKISPAGSYSYSYAGGEGISGNVSISVKKISDCRSWPCKELNSTQYTANSLIVNSSSPWFWNANLNNHSNYILRINTTSGTWGTGYYSVLLDVNGTDTGNAWFNTIAFYVDSRIVDENGTNQKYNIKPKDRAYFNTSITKNYKGWNVVYNTSDYTNATIDDVILKLWDSSIYQNREFNYPQDINVTIVNKSGLQINGTGLINISFNNGSWPSGYYYGELIMRSPENETSTGWLWFNVQPFRVGVTTNTYNTASDQCVNSTISVYEPSWSNNNLLAGNYSILSVFENVWSGSSSSVVNFNNFTNSSFATSQNITVCPNDNDWGAGSWGGYHYLNIKVKDNIDNATQLGWLSFRSVPFSLSWGSVQGGTGKATNVAVTVQVSVTNPLNGAIASGNLSSLYQWRYDSTFTGQESYVFKIGNCFSNVSGQCNATGFQNVTIYPNTRGWKSGYNYIQGEWNKVNSASSKVQDWSGIYFEGRETYNGYFGNSDNSGKYKYDFATDENLTIKVYARDIDYNSINVNITNVQYATADGNCWNEWCRSYTSATWGLVGGGVQTSSGSATLTIKTPSGGWSKGDYFIKASVSGSAGSGSITGGQLRVKEFSIPNITFNSPSNNQNITSNTFQLSANTTKNAQCTLYLNNFDRFSSYYCGNISAPSNGTTLTSQKIGACNVTQYRYNGTIHYEEYVNSNYKSINNGTSYSSASGSTGFTTGGTTHTHTFNVTLWPIQNYGIQMSCYDSDYNYASEVVAFNVTRGT